MASWMWGTIPRRRNASYVVHAADLQTVRAGNSLIKYDDDTYLIIPACNIDSRQQEMDHIAEWSKRNNLALNWSKIVEIVFSDSRKKHSEEPPPPMLGIARVKSLKVLGVTISNKLSVMNTTSSSARVLVHCHKSLASTRPMRHDSTASLQDSCRRETTRPIRRFCLVGLRVGNRSSTSGSVPPPWCAFRAVSITADR